MTPGSMIDLILSLALFIHVGYCFAWSHKNMPTIYKVLLLPNRNYLASRAITGCLGRLVCMAMIYGVLIWRFYMLLGAFHAWGDSATVLIILTSFVGLYRLWHRVYFERLINEANASGQQA